MHRFARRNAALSSALVLAAGIEAQAAARVFVSVDGDDANACENIATPCRTFVAGINRVDPSGEVIVLKTGSYGGATITKSVRINVPAGVVAFAATPFVVDVPGGVVVLRGLILKALTPGTGIGVTYTAAAALYLENCVLDGWLDGLRVDGEGSFFVKDSIFRNMSGTGLPAFPSSAALTGEIDNSRFESNGAQGIAVGGGHVTVRNSVLSNNGAGLNGFSGFASELNADKCVLTNNVNAGLAVNGAMAVARISNSMVTDNSLGLANFGNGAVLKTWGNNAIDGNSSNTSGTITMIALQ
jgi:hypothetical protein